MGLEKAESEGKKTFDYWDETAHKNNSCPTDKYWFTYVYDAAQIGKLSTIQTLHDSLKLAVYKPLMDRNIHWHSNTSRN